MSQQTSPRFDVIALVVSDLDASVAFYRRLGLDIPAEAVYENFHAEATLPGGLRLVMDTADAIRYLDPAWTAPQGSHRVALAFACTEPDEVDAVYDQLTQAGHDGYLVPFDAPWNYRYAAVHDPDGNSVELFAPLTASNEAATTSGT